MEVHVTIFSLSLNASVNTTSNFVSLILPGETNTDDGLQVAKRILNSSTRDAVEVILLMTDGKPTERLNRNLKNTVWKHYDT